MKHEIISFLVFLHLPSKYVNTCNKRLGQARTMPSEPSGNKDIMSGLVPDQRDPKLQNSYRFLINHLTPKQPRLLPKLWVALHTPMVRRDV